MGDGRNGAETLPKIVFDEMSRVGRKFFGILIPICEEGCSFQLTRLYLRVKFDLLRVEKNSISEKGLFVRVMPLEG